MNMNEMKEERISIVGKLYQEKIAYAKQYHGEHYNELDHLYQQATEAYVRSNSLCQGEVEAEQKAEHTRLFYEWIQREKDLLECDKNLLVSYRQ